MKRNLSPLLALALLATLLLACSQPAQGNTPEAPAGAAATSPLPAGVAAPSAQAKTFEYVVDPGDTLGAIADLYDVSVATLVEINHLEDANQLTVGQTLIIPVAGQATAVPEATATPRLAPGLFEYVVDPGDTLSSIAAQYGTTTARLMELNGLTNANVLYVGQTLVVPVPGSDGGSPSPTRESGSVDQESKSASAVGGTHTASAVQVSYNSGSLQVPILLYHHIDTLGAEASSDWYASTVTPGDFESQMAYLAENGFHTVKIMDVVAAVEGRETLPSKPVVVTFDDGYADCYTRAFPVLQRYGLIATFFIPANWIESAGIDTVTWAQIEEMSRAGMEFGSHSMTHPYLTQQTPEMLKWELQQSKALLDQHTVGGVEVLAYPFGLYNDEVLAQAKLAGYRAGATIEEAVFDSSDSVYAMPRLNIRYGSDLNVFAWTVGG